MRQGPTGRRPRGRPNRKQHGGPSRPNSYDSGGPEGRIRGNAHQVYEKYIGLARDALSAGDRVVAEAYFQHAEHYFRIVNSSTDPASAKPPQGEGNGRDAETQGRNQADPRDNGPANRDSGTGRHGQEPRGQDARRGDAARNQGEREQPARGAPSGTAQPVPAAPRRSVEDREGLDRVLGKEGAEAPQAGPNGPPDREPGQAPARRRPRQRPARRQESEAASEGGERREPPAARSGNGDASGGAATQDSAGEAASERQEATDVATPREKDQGSEPAGA